MVDVADRSSIIKDAVIVNADVSNSAAIDVSKISGVMPLAGGTFTNDELLMVRLLEGILFLTDLIMLLNFLIMPNSY